MMGHCWRCWPISEISLDICILIIKRKWRSEGENHEKPSTLHPYKAEWRIKKNVVDGDSILLMNGPLTDM